MTHPRSNFRSSTASDALPRRVRDALGYALQPIVNIHSGSLYGYTVLPHGLERLNGGGLAALYARARASGEAEALELTLHTLALDRFARLPDAGGHRLLLPVETALLVRDGPEALLELARARGLPAGSLILELSETADPTLLAGLAASVFGARRQGLRLAIRDFGHRTGGVRPLYEHPPDLLRLAPFFLEGIDRDPRKQLLLANTVQLAHVMGASVIATGVANAESLLACRAAGCDLVQGDFIAPPHAGAETPPLDPARIAALNAQRRHELHPDADLVEPHLERIPVLPAEASLTALFEAFRHNRLHPVAAVLDAAARPLGLVHEADIKEFSYSAYGRDLIANRAYARRLLDFVRPAPVVDVHDTAERLLEAYTAAPDPPGLIVTRDDRYLGFVSATALIQLINQRNLAIARDQNPLTNLPGNVPIHACLSRILSDARRPAWHLAYLDFDYFKAFNDHYGFRRGDRAILLFADLLRKHLGNAGWFVGHVGGDDFFAGIGGLATAAAQTQLRHLLRKFAQDARALYDAADRARGAILAHDRYGQEREMPLMRCSAAVLLLKPDEACDSVETLGRTIAELKQLAKTAASGMALRQGLHGPVLTLDEPAAAG